MDRPTGFRKGLAGFACGFTSGFREILGVGTMDNARALHDRSVMPLMGMIVDRTSFDETDDYGVDRDALESTSWSKEKTDRLPMHPVVMKNGKVRRRLRWRPKNMMKQKRPRTGGSQITGPPHLNSSNASVSSAANSRSGKSVHSFASTETATFNNTKEAQQRTRRFPLPRPNYSDTFAGVATIGSEGGLVHARMLPGKGSVSVDSSSVDSSLASGSAGPSDPEGAFDPYGLENPKRSPRKPGLPPLFNRRKKQQRVKRLSDSPQPSSEQTLERTAGDRTVRDLLSPKSMDSHASSLPSGSDDAPGALPKLNIEEMELERRVDLRIRRPAERRESLGSERSQQSRSGTKEMPIGVEDLIVLNGFEVDELRAESEIASSVESTPRRAMARPLPTPSRAVGQDAKRKEAIKRMRSLADPTLSQSHSTPHKMSDGADLLQVKSSSSAPLVSPASPKSLPWRGAPIHSSPSRQRDEEMLFSMAVPVINEDERTPPSSPKFDPFKHETGPVDVDDGYFLEVEKNLEAIHEMAAEHLQYGEYVEALEVFEEILRGQLARYGQEHFRVGTALHNIGIVHMKKGDFVNAAKVCKEAVRVRKIALGPFHPEVAVSLAQLGVAYMETEKHAKAITVFREALRIRRKGLGPRHPKVAKILNNIGCALYELNELEVAKVAFEEALAVQRYNLRETQSDSPSFSDQSLLSIASTLSNLGSIKLYWGRHPEAAIDLEEVLLLQQSVLGDEHPVVQKTQESLTWVEKARDLDADPSHRISLLSQTNSSESQMLARGMAYCGPSAVDISLDHSEVTGSPFEALERRLKLLNLDFGCGGQDISDSDISDSNLSAPER